MLIIGGGDTGNDCGGTVIRQGANSVMSIDLMPKPPIERDIHTPWPMWPYKLRGSSSVDEGLQRFWALNTLRFIIVVSTMGRWITIINIIATID